jgi:hypothetical protein
VTQPDSRGQRWREIETEAEGLVDEARRHGHVLRLVGSTGIRLHCEAAAQAMDELGRPSKDIDLVTRREDRDGVRRLLEDRGYEVDRDMLVASEGERFAFNHPGTGIVLDVFVDRLRFCHTIELASRLERHATTIPIEDLLLQKLQIVEQMPSDVLDAATLLATHALGGGEEPEAIDGGYISDVLRRDWGFHRTVTTNLDRLCERVGSGEVPGLAAAAREVVRERAGALRDLAERAEKTLAWKMRAKVGDRLQWWEDVEEARGHY